MFVWLWGRSLSPDKHRPSEPRILGSNPRGPATLVAFYLVQQVVSPFSTKQYLSVVSAEYFVGVTCLFR